MKIIKEKKDNEKYLKFFLLLVLFFINFPLLKEDLICAPNRKAQGEWDNLFCADDPEDKEEKLYGYEFSYKAGGKEYYDYWKGQYWGGNQFCYESYDNESRLTALDKGLVPIEANPQNVYNSSDNSTRPTQYVNINGTETNKLHLFDQACMTQPHKNGNESNYELLVTMNEELPLTITDTGKNIDYDFYFTLNNPYNYNITSKFKVRNFHNITEDFDYLNLTYGPNMSECLPKEIETTDLDDVDDDEDNEGEEENEDEEEEEEEEEEEVEEEPPCEREIILLESELIEWELEYAVPDWFYLTENITVPAHESVTVKIPIRFEYNASAGGYHVISGLTGRSDLPYYWPTVPETELEKFTKLEIILESDKSVGLSSYSMMYRRKQLTDAYNGGQCNSSRCGDGYTCEKSGTNYNCKACKDITCNYCDKPDGVCTKCFSISIDGQWNLPGENGTNLQCSLDYLDIRKASINEDKCMEAPPAIHWRVTTEFWMFITYPKVILKRSMHIIYKDFFAISLVITKEDEMEIYATPIEWLYEYPYTDEEADSYYNENFLEPLKEADMEKFLTETVGSYEKVTLKDTFQKIQSQWVYVRFAFDLDESKEYLNDGVERNLEVAQLYTGQENFPFHMKKFYRKNDNTYLCFKNFHRWKEEISSPPNPETNIYFRNFNIFREYIPQSIVTKFFNLHLIPVNKLMPQLLISFPFNNVRKTNVEKKEFEVDAYIFYIRKETGVVVENEIDKRTYKVVVDSDVTTLRPPRNFWRLNFLNLNEQAIDCDYSIKKAIKCPKPQNEYCFEDDKPFECGEGTEEKPYYLDITNVKCRQFCEVGYKHPPRYSTSLQRLYCNHKCDVGAKQCPSDEVKYTNIHSNFLCANGFFNLYYKCFNEDDTLNDNNYSGIFFSKFLKTPTIYIDLKKTYSEFAFDFWYYHDKRFRQKRYAPEDFDPEKYDEEKKKIIFLTDHLKVIYGTSDSYEYNNILYHDEGKENGIMTTSASFDKLNWNHFIFSYIKTVDGSYRYYATFANKQYYKINYDDKYSTFSAKSGITLSKIIFCNLDNTEYVGFGSMCKEAEWLDGFYRKIQIFDLRYSDKNPVYFMNQYEDDTVNGMLRHRYIYGLSSVIDNQLRDTISGIDGMVPFVYDVLANQNPDRTNYIIYESYFAAVPALIEKEPEREGKYVSSYKYVPPSIDVKDKIKGPETDTKNCDLVRDGTYCLSCKPGYVLFAFYCKGDVNNDKIPADYVYKNPGQNMPDRLSLEIKADVINASPSFTLFFFLKLYGFTTKNDDFNKESQKLLIFHEVKNSKGEIIEEFYLGYDPAEGLNQIYFYWNGRKLFVYNEFKERHFGHWIPISFAAYRERDRSFQMNMVHAALLYDDLPIDFDLSVAELPFIQLTQFTITNKWVGLLSNVMIYDRFIVNAWGIIRHYRQDIPQASDDVPDSVITFLPLKSNKTTDCLPHEQIISQLASGYKVICVSDYNPHFYTGCGSLEGSTVWTHQSAGPSSETLDLCHARCGSGRALVRCLGGHRETEGTRVYENQSCEMKSPYWKNWYPYWSNKKIRCGELERIDYARFQHAEVKNIASPQDTWAMDFWFYTNSFHNVYKRSIQYSSNSVKCNFKNFILEWNYHMRIKVYAEKDNDDPEDNQYTYFVLCQPVIVLEQPILDSDDMIINNVGHRLTYWTYVTCGINFNNKVYYQTNNNKMSTEYQFSSKILTIPSSKTNFTLNENSPSGYGFTWIREMRLWGCYDCAHTFRNYEYDPNDKNFNAVFHCFDGRNNGGASGTQTFKDDNYGVSKVPEYYMTQSADFPGYNLIHNLKGLVLCDESIFTYYNEAKDKCERQFNFARVKPFSLTIPSSRNSRYTMEFWFFVENSPELSPGFNLVWINHMSITILRDSSNKNTINALCFPQNYRDNVDGKGGQEVMDLYDKALNKDKYPFYQGSKKWNFVRCAVDQTRKLFYINDNLELDLEGEIIYGSTRNYRPFRYFKISSYELLAFQNINLNPTRVFLRQVRTYREYMDYRLMDMKYIRCDKLATLSSFWPITFCYDLNEIINPNWPCTSARSCFYCYVDYDCGLAYIKVNEYADGSISSSTNRWEELLRGEEDVYYPGYVDLYLMQFCDMGQSGGDSEDCEGTVTAYTMQSPTEFFWPKNDKYFLDLNTLTQTQDCGDYCRLPDTSRFRSYCLFKKGDNNLLNCAETWSKGGGDYNLYNANFECKPGYTKVYFECIDNKLVKSSAMYFSNEYSFQNLVYNTPVPPEKEDEEYKTDGTDERIISYYLEAWIKFDTLNYNKDITELEHYLYAFPHQIIKDPVDQKYKYSNLIISSGSYYYTLTAISIYEWNKMIIENVYDKDTKQFSIKFYLNYEFDNPEFSILNLDGSIYKLHFRGLAFCDQTDSYCRINDNPTYLRWGVAWYRNIRVWDEEITSLQLIQACEYGYTQLINAQYLYFSMTVDAINRNTVFDKIQGSIMELNYWIFYMGLEFKSAFDDDIRENYSVETFDPTFVNENNFISGITEDGSDYTLSGCARECKRCYSSSNSDCYECRLGYAIYGKQCKVNTGFFFKTPPDGTGFKKVQLKVESKDPYFNLYTQSPLTMTIWIKFFGIDLDKIIDGKIYYPMIYLYREETFIGYNYDTKSLVLVINNVEVYSIKAKKFIGNWAHFGISLHRGNPTDYVYFPHMLNFFIGQEVLIPISTTFDPTQKLFLIDNFSIDVDPICYYSSLKFFTTFYFAPYGHLNAVASTRGSNLIFQIKLFGSANNNCVADAELFDSTVSEIKPVCIADYNPYEDSNNICSSNSFYMDVIFKNVPPCELCNNICITNCIRPESSACTCNYNEGLYWVKSDSQYQSYECQKVDSINFAFFEKVTLNGISLVTNEEMTIVFWLNIYEYKDKNFDKLEIHWNQHLSIVISGNGLIGVSKKLIIECQGDYDIDNPTASVSITFDDTQDFNKWTYVRCSIDKFHKVMKINGKLEEPYSPYLYSKDLLKTSLTIEDMTADFNYGFSFVRELRLFSSYNFDFWWDNHHNLTPESFPYMLHSFSNSFNLNKLSDSKITDLVTGLVTKLKLKTGRIGYNYVIDYKYITLCNEGYVYNEAEDTCEIFKSNNCEVPRTFDGNCLKCALDKPYLYEDDTCVDDCSPNFYADEYLKQCRACDSTCYTCSGKKENECLSCTGDYYLIATLHICVLNCQKYRLVSSKPNECDDLFSDSFIDVPVYLNNSYDYNPKNKDYKFKIINRDNFTEINANISFSTVFTETLWQFSREETLELNKNYRYFDESDIPLNDPIISNKSLLHIDVDNNFFKYGYKYVFNLHVYSQNDIFNASVIHKYILIMNDYPMLGQFNILPEEGYISNNFLFTINKCTDDFSEKENLLYKFTYFYKYTDVVTGFQESTEEKLIQDWSNKSEALFIFPELNPEEGENGKYYVKGYCKDEFGLYYSEYHSLSVHNIPTESGKNLILNQTLKAIDLDEDLSPEQLSNRAEALSTMTVNFPKKSEILNRTNVTDFNEGIWQQDLILHDPVSSPVDLYCNRRGDSYVIYYYLTCDCSGYYGTTCQIDQESFQDVIRFYYKIYDKVRALQTDEYDFYLLNAIHLIVKSGASFFPVENMEFMLNCIDYINLYTNKFTSQMMEGNNYEIYFDIYNYLIEFGLSIANQLKYRNFIESHSKLSNGLYNVGLYRNSTLNKGQAETVKSYFNSVKTSLQSLLEFYSSNKKQLRFINRNINVYIALVNKDFDSEDYFTIEKKLYEPYFNFKECLEHTMIDSKGDPNYKLFLNAIVWKVSPFMSDSELYWNSSTPILSFKFLDYNDGKKIYLSECGKEENDIKLFFPVNSHLQTDRINRLREYLSPENQYPVESDIFNDPVYINKSGAVFNSTPEERQNQFFLGFNFSCKYYKVSDTDPNDISLSNETLDYHLYTKENYIQCLTNELMQEAYGEFVVDQYIVLGDFHINSRFFYLKHYPLLFWLPNYAGNQAFIYFIVLVSFYFAMCILYVFIEKSYVTKMAKLDSLKNEVARMNLPYREEYLFKNDLNLQNEVRGKLIDERNPDLEERNLDINDVNAQIIADDIGNYTKGLRNNEAKVNPNFFKIQKNPKKKNIDSFFPGEVDKKKMLTSSTETDLKGSTSLADVKKNRKNLKKFFNNEFRGLDTNANYETTNKDNNNLFDIEERFNEDEKEKIDSDGLSIFNANPPPKKGQKETFFNPYIFNENDQETGPKAKKGKSSPFFQEDQKEGKPKDKHKSVNRNIFQEGFDEAYKPKFDKPKIISENLAFFNNRYEDENHFHKGKEKKDLYMSELGKGLKEKKKPTGEKKNINAELKIGFRFKNRNRQIDLNDNALDLPKLAEDYNLETRLLEFHDLDAPFTGFMARNIRNRHIICTTFDAFSIVYSRYQRVGNFVAQLSLYGFFMSICFTADAKQEIYNKKNISEIFYFIIYCIISEIGACIMVHLPAYCFYVNKKKFRKLYNTIREDGGMNVLKQKEEIIEKGRCCWKFLGVLIQWIYIIVGFYFSFGFCSTYYYQRTTFILSLITTIVFDICIVEFIWEVFIGLLYYFREVGRCVVFFGEMFNHLRNINHLA